MFTVVQSRFRADLDEVKTILKWHEDLRDALLAPPNSTTFISSTAVDELRGRSPNRLPWQIFDHCAAVGRIYALFEKAVCDLVDEYLRLLPRVYPDYTKLPERLRQQHRVGVGQILAKWSTQSPLFGHLIESDIAAGFVDGIRGTTYKVLSDAFLVDPDNFRVAAIQRLFGYLGFDDCFSWVRQYPAIAEFCKSTLSSNETADSFLDGFVRLRNEAAHTAPSTLAGATSLAEYADFVVLVVQALGSLLRSRLLRDGCVAGCAAELGTVLHVWSDNVVGVRAGGNATLTVGDYIYAGKRNVEKYRIDSLQIGSVPHTSLTLTAGFEFGAKLDLPLKLGALLFRWSAGT